jgi:hypothetical protein
MNVEAKKVTEVKVGDIIFIDHSFVKVVVASPSVAAKDIYIEVEYHNHNDGFHFDADTIVMTLNLIKE